MSKRKFLLIALVVASLIAGASAQVMRAKVGGTVKDENGQPMGGVYVIFHNNENGQNFEMKTNSKGQYDGLVTPSNPGSMGAGRPLGYDVMVKRDKKDTDPL